MTIYTRDYAYRAADRQRSKSMGWHVSLEGLAYVIVIGASVLTFGLGVLGK